jgi:hypothetical protein
MRNVILLFFIISVAEAFGQQTAEWLTHLSKPQFSRWTLKDENVLSKYMEHDFSGLLTPNTPILGYIGTNYRRIKVTFRSVKKSPTLPNLYYISGSTTVASNKCDFEGTITVEQIREFGQMHYGVDDMYKDHGIKSQGILIGRYQFNENPRQNHVGIFSGVMTLWWYLDRNGRVQYDNLESHSDRFRNNQYVGTWTEYGNLEGKPCNWGEYRIPFSGDLDIGAGEFSANPKYHEAGWTEFREN